MPIQRPAPTAEATVTPGGCSGTSGLMPSASNFGKPMATRMMNGISRITMKISEESPTVRAPRMLRYVSGQITARQTSQCTSNSTGPRVNSVFAPAPAGCQ